MKRRYMAIWFRHLLTDWMIRRRRALKNIPFVLAAPERGRMIVKAVNALAQAQGIHAGMAVADCRAVLPALQVLDDPPGQAEKLLRAIAVWCIRYTPAAGIDLPDGLILDISGCAHLWGGEQLYLEEVTRKLKDFGYEVDAAIADTIGAAWAVSRFGQGSPVVEPGRQVDALLPLPPAALRLEAVNLERLEKLGLHRVSDFISMPRTALRRRFGASFLTRLDQASERETETIEPVRPAVPYQERLPCLEPIRTATGIEIGLKRLLEALCKRFEKESTGLRTGILKAYRVDGAIRHIQIGTNRPSRNEAHLFKLFEPGISRLEPGLGFELFVLEAPEIEEMPLVQDALWHSAGRDEAAVAELLDRLAGRVGMRAIRRYLPDEHYWPERSVRIAADLAEEPVVDWNTGLPRPLELLPVPEAIEVTVLLPDYPPMLFRYKGQVHTIEKADGPERIEQEWWLQQGLYRDYYCVEDERGARYWLFRLGDYQRGEPKWFIHGFFA